jgi:hypothetical protein
MPRRSSASFSVISPSGGPVRLSPPVGLQGTARQAFVDIVSACKAGHFQPQDTALLVEYCRATALADEAAAALSAGAVVDGKVSPWVVVQEKAQRAMAALALRLRLSPQGRSPTIPARSTRPLSYHERQTLMENGDDAVGS